MENSPKTGSFPPPVLRAETAADLMVPNPVSIRAEATAQDAVALSSAPWMSCGTSVPESRTTHGPRCYHLGATLRRPD